MSISKLRTFNQLAVRYVGRFGTRDDFKILLEIAAAQESGGCLTLKQLVLCCSVPESTLKRRLARLVRLGFVIKETAKEDRRVHGYTVAEKTMKQMHGLIDEIRTFHWR